MTMIPFRCVDCGGKEVESCRTYTLKQGEQRTIYYCSACDRAFSETKHTPLAYLKTPISVMVHVLSGVPVVLEQKTTIRYKSLHILGYYFLYACPVTRL